MTYAIRRFVVVGAAFAAGVGALVVATGGDAEHRISVVVPEATGLIKGYQVRAAGRPVGTVTAVSVTPDYRARVELRLDDEVWPVPTDSRLTIRMGGTIKLSERYLDLRRGTARQVVPDGGRLSARRFVAPTEFDDVFRTFDRTRRKDLNATIDRAGAAARSAGEPLARAVHRAPPALDAVRGTLGELGRDDEALHALVVQSDVLAAAVQRSNPGIARLVAGAAGTLSAIASEGAGVQRAFSEAPATFARARGTLGRATGTLDAVDGMTRAIAGGVGAARTLARPLDRTLRSLQTSGPDVRATLATTRTASPALVGLLDRARTVVPVVESASREGAKQLNCIRPYAPEIASFASTWGAGAWGSRGDRKDRYFRSGLGVSPYPALTPGLSGADLHRLIPGVTKTLVRPPGQLVDQSWLQPDCGQDGDTLDPTKDPEARTWDPLAKRIDLTPSTKGRR